MSVNEFQIRLVEPTREQREAWIRDFGHSEPVEIYEVIVPNYGSVLSLPGKEAVRQFIKNVRITLK